ncbi:MAG: hypothetical protein KC620_15800 [Myxococcales bacterium]|nr:hypothetical protein [Myxococcales bacterium]
MSLWDALKNIREKKAEQLVYVAIPSERVIGGAEPVPVEARKTYIRLWLAEMSLDTERKWYAEFAPVVHSAIELQFGTTSKPVTIPHVAGPVQLPDLGKQVGKGVSVNHALTPLLPFNGGSISIAAALVANKTADHLDTMLGVLGDLSKVITAPQLSSVLGIAGPLANGAERLLGLQDGRVMLTLNDTFVDAGGNADNLITGGYRAVVQAPVSALKAETLWVEEGSLRVGTSRDNLKPLVGYDYMLLRTETRTERTDWSQLTNLSTARDEALACLESGKLDEGDTRIKAAVFAALRCPELTRADAMRVARSMRAEYDELRSLMADGAIPGERGDFGALIASGPSVDEVANEYDLDRDPTRYLAALTR